MKRYFLFIITNLAVMLLLAVVLSVLGVNRFIADEGLNVGMLVVFSGVVGFTGAFVSLLMSKPMAKWTTGARVIDGTENAEARWLVDATAQLARKAGVGMPEVAIYEGDPNAFATGAFRDSSLVAVSTGLLQSMSKEEVEAVLAHEVAHVANGDMVTMTLIQGVVNTFVAFFARVVGYLVDRAVFKTTRGVGPGYTITVLICQIIFGILASIVVAWFSRQREFRADAGAAAYLGSPDPMISALRRLGGLEPGELPKSFRASGISDRPSFMGLFSSHPPIEIRIAALEERG